MMRAFKGKCWTCGHDHDEETRRLKDQVVAIGSIAINSVPRDFYTVPPAHGVFACAENPNALTVVFKRRPTADDIRSLHEIMRVHAKA